MAKKRSIDSGIRLKKSFSELTYRQRDLWHGMIAVADDQGRLPGEPAAVRSLVWPFDDVSIGDVDADLVRLEQQERILRYSHGNASYIQIVNWWIYQSMQWAGASTFPPPDGWQDRERFHGKGRVIHTLNWDTPGGFAIFTDDDEVNVNVNDNDKVKPRRKTKTTKVDDKGSQTAAVFAFYESNIGALTQSIADQLGDSIDTYTAGWVLDALELAVKSEKRSFRYAEGILKNWKRDGKDDGRKPADTPAPKAVKVY